MCFAVLAGTYCVCPLGFLAAEMPHAAALLVMGPSHPLHTRVLDRLHAVASPLHNHPAIS